MEQERAMGKEIERKFLVRDDGWRRAAAGEGTRIRQGYVETSGGVTVRVRVAGKSGFLTLKGPSRGVVRAEFEYRIPLEDAEEMLSGMCAGRMVEKTRWRVPAEEAGLTWEVDVYEGANAPLVTAEIELPDEGTAFRRPSWLGEEVSGEARYRNSELAVHPHGTWKDSRREPKLFILKR